MALINCPECGKEISDKAASCPNCGFPVKVNKASENEEYLCCPKCHSKELHAEKKGYSGGKALAGVVLTGGIGLLAGTIGSKDIQITCLKCGKRFKAGEALSSLDIYKGKSNEPINLPNGINIHSREVFTDFNYKCPLCNKIYNGDLNSCPKCGRRFLESDKTSIPMVKKGGCLTTVLFSLIISMGLFLSCGNDKGLPNIGDKVYLVKECLSAISEDDFAELNKVSNRKDESRLKEMILLGKVFIINPVDDCKMIEKKFGKCKIRVKADRNREIDLWVSSEFIKKK